LLKPNQRFNTVNQGNNTYSNSIHC